MIWNLEVQIVLARSHSCLSEFSSPLLHFLKRSSGRKAFLPSLWHCYCWAVNQYFQQFWEFMIDSRTTAWKSMIFVHHGKIVLPFSTRNPTRDLSSSSVNWASPNMHLPMSAYKTSHHQICQRRAQNICDKDLCVQNTIPQILKDLFEQKKDPTNTFTWTQPKVSLNRNTSIQD